MDSSNVWGFERFQVARRYRFRLKSTGATVVAVYIGEKGRGPGREEHQREFEFETPDGKKSFLSSEILDPLYYE
jgi:hypothetical protein